MVHRPECIDLSRQIWTKIFGTKGSTVFSIGHWTGEMATMLQRTQFVPRCCTVQIFGYSMQTMVILLRALVFSGHFIIYSGSKQRTYSLLLTKGSDTM